MKIKSKLAKKLMFRDTGDEMDGFVVKDPGEWIDEGKYSHKETIVKFGESYYSIFDSRSGSYFSDYYNDSDDWGEEIEIDEVIPKQITKTIYVKKEKK
jgi:hypothetical protein